MKILHLLGDRKLPRCPENDGASGVVHATIELARAQADCGHDVSVAIVGRDQWETSWHGVRLIALRSMPWARFRVNGRVLDFRVHLPYVFYARSRAFDAIHGQFHRYLRFVRSRRRLIHFHSDPFYGGTNHEGFDLSPADFARVRNESDAQIAVSHFVAQAVRRGLGQRGNVHVVHNGVDASRFAPGDASAKRAELRASWRLTDGDVAVLFAGAILPDKGAIHLAHAFARVAAHNPSAHLVVAGSAALWGGSTVRSGPIEQYEDEVRSALQVPRETGRVHQLGSVPYSQMAAVLAASDIVVVPSVVQEGFGLAVLEAMAAGRPVIAAQVGGIPELLNEHCGILVPPRDEDCLATAIDRLMDSAEMRRQLGLAGRERSAQFSWSAAAEQVEAIYQTIPERPAR